MQQAYDQHLNMILGDVEETITSVEIDDETYEEIIKVSVSVECPCFLQLVPSLMARTAWYRVMVFCCPLHPQMMQ